MLRLNVKFLLGQGQQYWQDQPKHKVKEVRAKTLPDSALNPTKLQSTADICDFHIFELKICLK